MESRQICRPDAGIDIHTCIWIYFRTEATTVEPGQVV